MLCDCTEAATDRQYLAQKLLLTEGFCINSWESSEFLITKSETRGLVDVENMKVMVKENFKAAESKSGKCVFYSE